MQYDCALLADNHQDMLEGIRGLLETLFKTIVMVADKESLFEVTEKVKPDLIVMDLALPENQEVDIVRELKDRNSDLRCIILSVYDEPTVLEKAIEAGAGGYVLKWEAATDLIPAVQHVLKGGTYISPSIKHASAKQLHPQ